MAAIPGSTVRCAMLSVEDALARVLALITPLPPEAVALINAAGRVLAAEVIASRDQPPFAASAMDGYALDAAEARPGARFLVIGEAGAGYAFAGRLRPGEALRIFTGAPVPAGANRVVIQEDVSRDGDTIVFDTQLDAGSNIRPIGSDFRAGARLRAPRRLSAADVALIAAMNVPVVQVFRRPVVAIIATGDELVMPGEPPGPDQIIASNSFALAAMARAEGAEVRMLPIARDTEASLQMVLRLAEGADLIVTIGGASVGDHDLVARAAESLGMERAFYKIAMRPGKPLMAGKLRGVPMLGLPGNPVSSIVCGYLFMLPALRALQGLPDVSPRYRRAILTNPLAANGPRAHYMRAVLQETDVLPNITAFERQDSALLSVLSDANALLFRPILDGPRATGDQVLFLQL